MSPDPQAAPAQRTAIIVAGMHRSGTSLTTRIANLLSGKQSIIQTVDANEPAHPVREPTLAAGPEHVPEGWDADLMPWFLRRLEQAELLAAQMRKDADQLLKSSAG